MKNSVVSLTLAALMALPNTGAAGPMSENMASCLVDQTTPQDRDLLMKWVVVSYAHAEGLDQFITLQDGAMDALAPDLAALMERLLIEDCKVQSAAALAVDGAVSFQEAFRALGTVAGNEAATNPQIAVALSQFTQYLDFNRINNALGQ